MSSNWGIWFHTSFFIFLSLCPLECMQRQHSPHALKEKPMALEIGENERTEHEQSSIWYDEITDQVKQSSRQYARDTLRYAVQNAMKNTIGDLHNEEEKRTQNREDLYVNKEGKTLGQILDATLTQKEKEKEQEREVHTYFILFITGFVILGVTLIILVFCCVYNRLAKYIALINSIVWLIWVIYTCVRYYQEYCEWVHCK